MEKPKTLQEAIQHFSDEQVCIDAVAKMRWPDGVFCPHAECGAKDPYYLSTQKRWKCRKCRKQFSVKVGSIFEDSPIPLQKWLPAIWLLTNCKNGVSSWEIHRALGVTQKTAWFMLHRIRLGMKEDYGRGPMSKIGGEGSEVEVDETFVGGQKKNMHREKQVRYEARGDASGKTVVQGILDRTARQVRARVMPDVKRETLQSEILRQVKYGTQVYTDEAVAYEQGLQWRFVHDMVNKTESYVRGRVHVNGVENFWSLLKRGLRGTYVAVEPFHLDRYLDEQVFRFNNRKKPMDDYARFEKVLGQVAHKRLTYAELTGKTEDARTTTPEPF
ncbi:MAG TPA: IS1595 family transposase [Candidatus Dormibacteraeota bacterium]|jgi:transposase-like protein|nr:IS1595 family transposase [Candidatus Dormibacteraeota bacterium]